MEQVLVKEQGGEDSEEAGVLGVEAQGEHQLRIECNGERRE